MQHQAILAGFVVVRGNHQETVGPLSRQHGSVRPPLRSSYRCRQRPAPCRPCRDRGANDFDVLGRVEGGGFAGRAHRDKPVYRRLVDVDEVFQIRIGDCTVVHGGRQCGENARK